MVIHPSMTTSNEAKYVNIIVKVVEIHDELFESLSCEFHNRYCIFEIVDPNSSILANLAVSTLSLLKTMQSNSTKFAILFTPP